MSYYDTIILADNPTGYWHINETSGTVATDSTSNHYNGVYSSGLTYNQAGAISGDPDTSIGFTGGAYFAFPYNLNIQAYTALTIEFWIKQTGLWEYVVITADSSTINYYLDYEAYVSGSGDPVIVADDFSFVGSYEAGDLAKVATYNYKLSDAQRLKHFLIGQVLLNGSAALLGSGTDTASFDTFRVTQYPDPSVSLVNAGRASNSVINWNGNFPANTSVTVQTSLDNGVTWQAATNGGTISGITPQTVNNDSFTSNTSANYTQTFGTGGSSATWTWDTANSRIVAVGGSKAALLWTGVSASDTDMWIDLYQSENSGLVWGWQNASNYYELVIKDSAASGANTATINKIVSGSSSQLTTGSINFPTQTHHRFHLTMLSSVISVSMDENTILTYTDGSPFGAGSAGLRNDTGTSYIYMLQITPQNSEVSSQFLCVKQTLSTTDPTQTPQITDHQALISDSSFGAGVTIPSVDYTTKYVSDNLDDLNTQSNYWWQIGNGSVTFQARNAVNAPYILQSTDILTGTLPTVEYSGDMYRNEQVLTGVYETSVFTQSFIGDGSSKTWNVANPIQSVPTITLNGLTQTVGLQGVDTGKAFYWQNNNTAITQDNSGTTLRSGIDVLSVAYLGAYGINFQIDNTGQISNTIDQASMAATDGTSGIVSAIEDVSQQNMDINAATTYANQLLQRYGSIARTITFMTLHQGLKAGQSLTIFVPEVNIFDSVFLVVEVNTTYRSIGNGVQPVYSIVASEVAALSSWVKYFSKVMRSVKGTSAKT